jgi:hypothetical protein
MRAWYAITTLAALTAIGCYFLVTEHLARIGVDVTVTRAAISVLVFAVIGFVTAEEIELAVSAKLEQRRSVRTREALAQAGQVSIALDPGRGALSAQRNLDH